MQLALVLALFGGSLAASQFEQTLCGPKLAFRMREMCTPYGEEQPCFRHPDLDEKSVQETLEEISGRYRRSQERHLYHHIRYLDVAADLCCKEACDPVSILSKFCCKPSESKKFYKHLRELAEGRPWSGIF